MKLLTCPRILKVVFVRAEIQPDLKRLYSSLAERSLPQKLMPSQLNMYSFFYNSFQTEIYHDLLLQNTICNMSISTKAR